MKRCTRCHEIKSLAVCNKDYPSCLCYNEQSVIPDFAYLHHKGCKNYIDLATDIFLDCIEQAISAGNKRAGKK